jgi:HEPN domain-containing protein
MSTDELALDYLRKARVRVDMLAWLLDRGAYSDVVREAQEAVELCLKGALRQVGIDPPKIHDVGGLVVDHAARFPGPAQAQAGRVAAISKQLRKDRELAFYGDVDFLPGKSYGEPQAAEALAQAREVLRWTEQVVGERRQEKS